MDKSLFTAQDYSAAICKAADTLISKRLENVFYDQTIICTITDNKKRNDGVYTVTDGSISFKAYSNINTYNIDDIVYVTIPQSNYSEQKIIIGKYTANSDEPFNYVLPFDTMINITGNLIVSSDAINRSLIANLTDTEEITIWEQVFAEPLIGYTILGLEGYFSSWLKAYGFVAGDYGLKLKITSRLESTIMNSNSQEERFLIFNSTEMLGDPFAFDGYFRQQKIFDISSFGPILKIELIFYQIPLTFKLTDGTVFNYTDFNTVPSKNLFIKQPNISLGFDISSVSKEQVQLFTTSSRTYLNSASNIQNTKTVKLRWIYKEDSGNFKALTPEEISELTNIEIYWYHYKLGAAAVDAIGGLYWESIPNTDLEDYKCQYKLHPDTVLSSERIKAVIKYNNTYYTSNIIEFINEEEGINLNTINIITACSLNCEDESNGNYLIYDNTNFLFNNKIANENKILKVYYSNTQQQLLNEKEPMESITSIDWFIPLKNTMLSVIEDIDYIDSEVISDSTDFYLHIHRDLTETNVNTINQQTYHIKSYYSQSATNNTINCIINKNGIQYKINQQFKFGIAGTNGSNYSLVLTITPTEKPYLYHVFNSGEYSQLQLSLSLYNVENKEIDISSIIPTFTCVDDDGGMLNYLSVVNDSNKYYAKLTYDETCSDNYYFNTIVHVSLDYNGFVLSTYLSLPVVKRTDQLFEFGYTTAPSELIYTTNGDIFYSKNLLEAYSLNQELLEGNWSIRRKDIDNIAYLPIIRNNNLLPQSIYIKGLGIPHLIFNYNGNEFIQPIYIVQNKYPSRALNQWDGSSLEMNQENGSILSTMLSAGKKEDDNTFTGVILGDWSNDNHDIQLTGLYGFCKGEMSFAFREDGTGFIGTQGRIEFDGNSSIIKSKNTYRISEESDEYLPSMSIDLQEGSIATKNILIDSTPPKETSPYFNIIQSDYDNITKPKNLIYISNEEYYLQSANYHIENGAVIGMRINLTDGAITGGTFSQINTSSVITGTIDKATITNASISGTDTTFDGGSITNTIINPSLLTLKANSNSLPINIKIGNNTSSVQMRKLITDDTSNSIKTKANKQFNTPQILIGVKFSGVMLTEIETIPLEQYLRNENLLVVQATT